MKRTTLAVIIALVCAVAAAGQGRSHEDIRCQLIDLNADRVFTLTYDDAGNTSKLMAIAENLPQKEVERAGAQAINFAAAFTFTGKVLMAAPEKIALTFWVLTKKPVFANSHRWIVNAGGATVDLGDARYAAKATEKMEYLNFVVPLDDLSKIATTGATFRLGSFDFTFTPAQIKLLSNMLAIAKN